MSRGLALCDLSPPNKSLELTPSVWALEWLVTPVGIRSIIESFWERSSAPSRYAPLAAAMHLAWLWILSAGESSLSCQRRSRSGSLAGEGLREGVTRWTVVLAGVSPR